MAIINYAGMGALPQLSLPPRRVGILPSGIFTPSEPPPRPQAYLPPRELPMPIGPSQPSAGAGGQAFGIDQPSPVATRIQNYLPPTHNPVLRDVDAPIRSTPPRAAEGAGGGGALYWVTENKGLVAGAAVLVGVGGYFLLRKKKGRR